MSGSPSTGTDGRELRDRGQRTRARLLAAGTTVLADRGFHGTRVADIVAAAETSHGTFYRYFESKEALFDELVAAVATEFGALVDALPSPAADPDQGALRDWLASFADLYRRNRAVLEIWTEAELAGGSGGAAGDRLFVTLGDALRSGTDLDPIVAPLTLLTMCERLNYYVATGQVRTSRDAVVDTLADVIARVTTPARTPG